MQIGREAGVQGTQGRGGEQGTVGELATLSVVLIVCPDMHAHVVRITWTNNEVALRFRQVAARAGVVRDMMTTRRVGTGGAIRRAAVCGWA